MTLKIERRFLKNFEDSKPILGNSLYCLFNVLVDFLWIKTIQSSIIFVKKKLTNDVLFQKSYFKYLHY